MELMEYKGLSVIDVQDLSLINGGLDWGKVATSALLTGGIGAASGGLAFANAGTVVMPVVGTVSGGLAGAIVGGTVGVLAGAAKSIWKQL